MTFKPLTVPTKTLLVSITAGATTFRVNNIKGWDGINLQASDFGTQAYCVFRNATRTRMEIMEFDPSTIASTNITIVRRGLDFDGDLTTEITANKFAWTKGDTYVDLGTDAPQVWQWIKEYADNIAFAGTPDASTTTKGIVEVATRAQATLGTGTGETGATLVNPTSFGPLIETTTGVTHSLTTVADQRVLVFAKGDLNLSGLGSGSVKLNYNSVQKDVVDISVGDAHKQAFNLMYTETPGAATQNITVTTTGGSLANVVIMVLKF